MIGLVLSSACGGRSTRESEQEPEVRCQYGGATYRPGEGFPDEDGCNTCSCGPDGTVTCTARSCAPTCTVDGKTYLLGEYFLAPDGCTTCVCDLQGLHCDELGCSPGCTYGGLRYEPGQSFPAEDRCNTCTCGKGAQISCTDLPCPSTPCLYLGVQRRAGESFPSRDGCNTCECLSDGGVACTEINCPCKPEAEWWRNYVARSPRECNVIDFGCPAYTTHFGNECGCGCEMDQRCPQYMAVCPTPETCELCPFSIRPDPV